MGLAHVGQWALPRGWPSPGWGLAKRGVGSCPHGWHGQHQHWFYNHLLVMFKLTACLASSAACGNDFVPSLKRSLMGTAYSVFAYSLSGFAVKVGTARSTLW